MGGYTYVGSGQFVAADGTSGVINRECECNNLVAFVLNENAHRDRFGTKGSGIAHLFFWMDIWFGLITAHGAPVQQSYGATQ